MSRQAWLTPDALPSAVRECVLRFPDSEEWAAIVRGCLFLLSEERNFEEFGSLSVATVADRFRQTLFEFLEGDCVLIPIGASVEYSGSVLPANFLWRDGSLVLRATYPALYAVLGDVFGANDGTTNFRLPGGGGRIPIMRDSGQAEFDVLGETGGAKTHTLLLTESPIHSHTSAAHNHTQAAHNHTQDAHTHTVWANLLAVAGSNRRAPAAASSTDNVATNSIVATNQPATAVNVEASIAINSSGSGGSHNNLQPYYVSNFIIRAL